MITDSDIEKAVEWLISNASKAAQAKANRIYLEEYRKVVKAQCMKASEESAIGAKEADAYSDPKYIHHLTVMQDAIEEDEKLTFLRKAAEAKLEAWRTMCSNNRTLGKL